VYMNDFIIARPGARFLKEVLERISERTKDRGKQDHLKPGNAVFETGPGIFTEVIEAVGDPENYKVRVLPWQSIHPLPDMSCRFGERPKWERMILDGSWKTRFEPYVVHYWYHTWCKGGNTLEHYSKH